MNPFFAQIIVGPLCDYEPGSFWWWWYSCWVFSDATAATAAAGVAIAGYVGVQLWAANKQPKA